MYWCWKQLSTRQFVFAHDHERQDHQQNLQCQFSILFRSQYCIFVHSSTQIAPFRFKIISKQGKQQHYIIFQTSMKLLLSLLIIQVSLAEIYSVGKEFEVSNQKTAYQLGHAIWEAVDRSTGWNRIYIYTSPQASPLEQHRAAGFLEGYATYSQIHSAFINFMRLDFNGNTQAPQKIETFMQNQINYMDQMVKLNTDDPFWQYIGYYLEQVRYMHAGYRTRIRKEKLLELDIQFLQFYFLTSVGDLEDLITLETQELRDRRNCNAYVSLSDSKLHISHGTHNRYTFLLRIFKTWNFPRKDVPLQSTSFTSRPGDLISKDDFFILSSGLRVLETSLNNYVKSNIYEVQVTSAPSWIRTLVANHLSSTPEQWIHYFNTSRSGTHNNQWIIIDSKRLGSAKGIVYIFEQAFSISSALDMTSQLLAKGYVAGYNMPITMPVYHKLGLNETKDPNYRTDYRAQVFERIHPLMKNIEDMKYYLVENEEKELTEGIAPRYDLINPSYASPFGMTDCKIVTVDTLSSNYFWAVSGPTTSHGHLPVFDWKNWQSYPHDGLPQTYDFGWQKIPLDIEAQSKSMLTSVK